jgi:hypothetical protein
MTDRAAIVLLLAAAIAWVLLAAACTPIDPRPPAEHTDEEHR